MEIDESRRSPRQRLPALRMFEAVSRHLSVTRAAEELFVTPGAVSQQVKQLEQSLGVFLLERQHRRVALTPEGARLAFSLTSSFERIDRALMEITSESQAMRLRLCLMPTFAIRWLMPRLSSFYGEHPGIEIEMSTVSTPDDSSLANADFAVRVGSGNWNDAESDHLFDDELLPVCSLGTAAKLNQPDDMSRQHLLHSMVRNEGWQVWIEGHGLDVNAFRKHRQFANAALACQAAIDGLGVAIVQREYVTADLSSGRLVAPFPAFGRPGLAYYLV